MREADMNYQQISDKLSAEGHLSPRGKPLNNRIVWSIHMKRLKWLKHRSKKFEPIIKDVNVKLL